MNTRTIISKVAGVTYEGRQAHIAKLRVNEPVRIVPEPDNKFDPNALVCHVALNGEVLHVGYVPRDLAKIIAPLLDGEAVMSKIKAITGGFETYDGDIANLGLQIEIEYPFDENEDEDREDDPPGEGPYDFGQWGDQDI